MVDVVVIMNREYEGNMMMNTGQLIMLVVGYSSSRLGR